MIKGVITDSAGKRRSYARFIGLDAKGRVWFTEFFGAKIGYVDPTGEETKVAFAK
jgi:streptogramin lyase